MPTDVIMPALGMSQETGRLIAWLKNEGEQVEQGEPIMEIETDKTTVEVEASASGLLANLMAQAGDDVPVGHVIALIIAPGESAPAATAQAVSGNGAKLHEAESASTGTATPVARRMATALGVDTRQIPTQGKRVTRADVEAFARSPAPMTSLIPASPKARRLAEERGMNIGVLAGSGPGGAVLAADVPGVASTPPAPIKIQEAPASSPQIVSGGQLWRRMAQRLTESWQTISHFYLKREVNAEALVGWREDLQKRIDTKITYTDLLIKLVAAALRQHPQVNGQWAGEAVTFNEHVNIGLAVVVEQGLHVPVIHDADGLGVTAIAHHRQEMVSRVQNGKLRPDDLQGGTFTISNLGMYGIDEFSAIVNPPQAAILAVGRIADRVVPREGQIVIRPMLTLSLSCDHRVVDGVRGAQFLNTLSNLIETPLSVVD